MELSSHTCYIVYKKVDLLLSFLKCSSISIRVVLLNLSLDFVLFTALGAVVF